MAASCSVFRTLRKINNNLSFSRSWGLLRASSYSHKPSQDDTKFTHFGYETVLEEEKEQKVYKVFENVAEQYDVMNDAMSGGVHRLWKDAFIRRLAPQPGIKLLDVAGGTGDIAFRVVDAVQSSDDTSFSDLNLTRGLGQEDQPEVDVTRPPCHVTVCDINQNMLEVGRRRAVARVYTQRELDWVQGNAESLPIPDACFDAYTIAFGIRNCTHVDKVLEEAYRVLKPGGRFLCLEFSAVKNPLIGRLYDAYSLQVIPVLGQVIAGDWQSYQYLVESIRQFPDQEKFAGMIRAAGFSAVTYENLTFGVSCIHSGFKL